ncbi:MAG: hypothetical protein EOO04_34135 [Chitinophagaceae bacterium]|nr:MAG: hypothetical protein EOO04_34135 [Chitinophagaceae bacterium]
MTQTSQIRYELNLQLSNKSKIGETPLHYAAEIGKPEFISLLLKNKANPNIRQSVGVEIMIQTDF